MESQGRTAKGDVLWEDDGVKVTQATRLPEKPRLTAYKQGHALQRGWAVPRGAGASPAIMPRVWQGSEGGNTASTAGRGWFVSQQFCLQRGAGFSSWFAIATSTC